MTVSVEGIRRPHSARGTPAASRQLTRALAAHWPEYLMEAAELGLFMISACLFTALLAHPASPLYQAIDSEFLRRTLMGVAMGCTAVGIIYSPFGQRSGGHFNPAVTFTYLSLGKVERWDALFYVIAQCSGGILGVLLSGILIGAPLRHAAVNWVVTAPGAGGKGLAFLGELLISFLMIFVVLTVSNTRRTARFTPLFAGALLATFIAVESPVSGTSMNPARTVASAVPANQWNAWWIYFTAPLGGMLLGGLAYRAQRKGHAVFCAKLHHDNDKRCIFRCNYGAMEDTTKQGG